jgi:hypothetical protein
MTCKLNLFFFLIFIGVLGLNFYLDSDSSGSVSATGHRFPKSSLDKLNYEYATFKTNEQSTSFKSQLESAKISGNSNTDTLKYMLIMK